MSESKVSTLQLLLDALYAMYPSDPSSPGVVMAKISDAEFYVSIVRYRKEYGEDKIVLSKGRNADLPLAMRQAATDWFANYAPAAKTPGQKDSIAALRDRLATQVRQ